MFLFSKRPRLYVLGVLNFHSAGVVTHDSRIGSRMGNQTLVRSSEMQSKKNKKRPKF
jgi:hypothetical protein